MSRLIDAEKEMEREGMAGNCRKCKHYISSLKECAGGPEMSAVCHFLYYEAYGEDVAPVRHGYWELVDGTEPRRYGCSECKRLSYTQDNYCSYCGARMDGEEEDEE